MLYNVSQLLREPTGSTRSFELNEPVPEGPDGSAAGLATGRVRLLRTHSGLLLYAVVDVQVTTSCARCLGDFSRTSRLNLEEECYPTIEPGTGRRMDPPDQAEGVVHIDPSQMLDLSEVFRQYLLTDEPLKSLCRPDCLGICSECGADLNEDKCKCDATPIDPRWEGLAGLLQDG